MVMKSFEDKLPKGFGDFFDKNGSAHAGDLEIRCTTLDQLTDKDVEQIDAVRERALDSFEHDTGNRVSRVPISEELRMLPEGLTPLDKLVLRAYEGDKLVAYAHVLCGWPHSTEWTIEQLILNPDYRLKGIGTRVVSAIEELANHAEIRATAIMSMPSRPGAASFWNKLGYETEEKPAKEKFGDASVNILRKSLY